MTQGHKFGLTAEVIQEKINQKLSAKNASLFEKVISKIRAAYTERILSKFQFEEPLSHKVANGVDKLQASIHTSLRQRVCHNICAGILFIGILSMTGLFGFLLHKRLAPRPLVEKCDLDCTVRSAQWARLDDAHLRKLGSTTPAKAFDALSTAWLEHHSGKFAEAHESNAAVARLADAHKRLDSELKDVGAKWKQIQIMKDGPEKEKMLMDIIKRSDKVQSMAASIHDGKSFNHLKLEDMTPADRFQVRSCSDILRAVGTEACLEDDGITTGFLRAMGVGGTPEKAQAWSPTWPINKKFPGLRALDADHGIYVVDNFLSAEEATAVVKSSSNLRLQNRSHLSRGSFVQLHSTVSKHQKHEHHKAPKWMYSGLPGALIQLDVKGTAESQVRDCKVTSTSAQAWTGALAPLFQERGQAVQSCEKNGFGDTRFFDVACPQTSQAQNITQKLARLAQVSESNLQPLNVLHFGRGDFDFDHYDTDADNANGKVAPMMTMMVYLSTVKGGNTYFPNLDLRVEPIIGRALIFPTMTMNLTNIVGSLHAEEEVKRGDKWVLSTSVLLGKRDQSMSGCSA